MGHFNRAVTRSLVDDVHLSRLRKGVYSYYIILRIDPLGLRMSVVNHTLTHTHAQTHCRARKHGVRFVADQ